MEAESASRPEMTFLEHLDELRSRLLRSLAAIGIAFLACWTFSEKLVELLVDPTRRYLPEGRLVFTYPTEAFVTYMKASLLAAVFVAAPVLLYQCWAFVAPGLYRSERRYAVLFVTSGSVLFAAGGYFGYEVALPAALQFLVTFGAPVVQPFLSVREVLAFETKILIGMGLTFQLPVLTWILTRIGLLTPRWMLAKSRYAVVGVFLVAAIITPTGDVVTQSIFAAPMLALYYVGVVVCWLGQPRSEPDEATEGE